MIDFIVCRDAVFGENRVKIDNNILNRVGGIVAGIADRRKDSQVLPFAYVRVKVAAGGDRSIRRDH